MSLPAVRVSHLSKRYQLGLTHAGSIRELASHWTDRLLRRKANLPPSGYWGTAKRSAVGGTMGEEQGAGPDGDSFWALKDVSFEVQPGEVLGIIGRNGAGKSTLLKVLSRITSPTEGRVEINGRVASLLEVGTGFHPELTGRENVFLNGAILGMTKAEIRSKFDEIITFAEIDKFIDTPVKRYSSGMYVRLAFAVAAHLEPEILIVDEVLAVGDAEFQKKCLGKMSEVANRGRTVLFVSHNMDAVRRLCSRGILLKGGQIQAAGSVDRIVNDYLSVAARYGSCSVIRYPEQPKDTFHIEQIQVLDRNGVPKQKVCTWDAVRFRVVFNSPREVKNGSVVLQISTTTGSRLLLASTKPDQSFPMTFHRGTNSIDCFIPQLMLSAGQYHVGASLAIPNIEFLCDGLDYGSLEVDGRDVFNSGLSPNASRSLIPMDCRWEMIEDAASLPLPLDLSKHRET